MTVYILCGIIVMQSLLYRFERKDLYNRIMSKNLTEYKNEPCKRIQTAHEKAIERWRRKGRENQ